MSDLYFKATDGNRATHGGDYLYRKGRWTRHEDPVPCRSGWHVARNEQVLHWLAPTLWLAEIHPDAEVVEVADKVVASRIRVVERLTTWNDRTARLFAADCAEDTLALVPDPDPRSLEAVAVARRFANGEATATELVTARADAMDAVMAATSAATSRVGGAARTTTRVSASAAARTTASASAKAAARAAASVATGRVGGAVWAAARKRQYRRLLSYLELTDD